MASISDWFKRGINIPFVESLTSSMAETMGGLSSVLIDTWDKEEKEKNTTKKARQMVFFKTWGLVNWI